MDMGDQGAINISDCIDLCLDLDRVNYDIGTGCLRFQHLAQTIQYPRP